MYLFAHSFCASGIWAQPDMVLCVRVSHTASIEVSSWAAVSSEGSAGEDLLSNSLWWLLAGLVPEQLLDWGPQLFKGDGLEATLSCSPHGSLQLVSSEQAHERSQRECKQDRSHSLLQPHFGSDVPHLCHFLLVRSKYQVQLTPKGRSSHKDRNTRRWGNCKLCHKLSATLPFAFHLSLFSLKNVKLIHEIILFKIPIRNLTALLWWDNIFKRSLVMQEMNTKLKKKMLYNWRTGYQSQNLPQFRQVQPFETNFEMFQD